MKAKTRCQSDREVLRGFPCLPTLRLRQVKPGSAVATGRRAVERGAVLLVVLIVMVALLGLGMTGLFLTSGSIQMNTNINLRNQALVVAEAGIERARRILNDPSYTPPIPTFLAGSNGSGVEIPASTSDCDGQRRGAILVDPFNASAPCTGTPCTLNAIQYPSLDRTQNLPSSAGNVATAKLGTYTVYVRQDMADCRMGNFVCDMSPPSSIDAGIAFGVTTCTPPVGAPNPPNGGIVIRSEGVAVDNRTRVVLEVTMAPAQGLQKPQYTPISALCSAGARGCDDNSSVQSGIVVNSGAPPPSFGGSGDGGANGTGGMNGTGGAVGTGGATTSPGSGVGGSNGTGGSGSGGSNGTGGAPGSGGSTGCGSITCPLIATMGLYGLQTSVAFSKWLADHSSKCVARDLDTEHNVITDGMLTAPTTPPRPYDIIIVLDVGHLPQDYTYYHQMEAAGNLWAGVMEFVNPNPKNRQFSWNEGQVIKRWVQNGGGLLVTQGYADGLNIISNFNTIVEPLGLVYYSPDCGLNANCPQQLNWQQNTYGVYTINAFAAHPLTAGMTTLYASGYWPISGYPITTGSFPTVPTPVGTNYQVLATTGCQNCKVPNLTTNLMVAGTVGNGRVLAYGDEWVTFDYAMTDKTYGTTATAFWNNALKWLAPRCP
jgi:hypothetical protein